MKTLTLARALVTVTSPALMKAGAQATATQPHELTPDQVLERYDKQLSLSADQKTKLRPVIVDRQRGVLALRNDTASSPHDKLIRLQQLRADSTRRINEILTPDQQKKYTAMEAEQEEKMKERRRGKTGTN